MHPKKRRKVSEKKLTLKDVPRVKFKKTTYDKSGVPTSGFTIVKPKKTTALAKGTSPKKKSVAKATKKKESPKKKSYTPIVVVKKKKKKGPKLMASVSMIHNVSKKTPKKIVRKPVKRKTASAGFKKKRK